MRTKLDWNDSRVMESYERERARHRRRNHRITYDCESAKTIPGNRVRCSRGKILHSESTDGSIYLLFVIRGRTCGICKTCSYFSSGDN